MEAFFYMMLFVGIIGAFVGRDNFTAKHFYNNDPKTQYASLKGLPTIWIGVKHEDENAVKIKVRVVESELKRLAHDIEIVTKGNIMAESYIGYTYREILQGLTKEQLMDIKDLRSFLV